MKLNPLLIGTAAPPIPEAKAWAARYRGTEPLIDLSQAVPGYAPPPEFLACLAEAAATRDTTAYGEIVGDAGLRTRYAEHVSGLYGGAISADEIAITAGCNQGFVVTMLALAKSGDAVILPTPWYFNHKMSLDMLGIEAVALPCRAHAGFVPDAAAAEHLIGRRTRAVVLVTPNNPTGAVYPPATIRGFAELCAERGIALVIDETYRDFIITGGRPHDLIAGKAWRDVLIQLYSFSKAYCIPGHRTGAIAASAGFIAERAAAFRSAFAGLGGWSVASIGAYFAYVRHPFPGRRGIEVAEWLAAERGVLGLPGSYFGEEQDDFLRVALANVESALIGELPERLAGRAESRLAAGGRKR